MSILNHLAIIIDGNRRWAKKNNLASFNGHKKGMDNVKKIGDRCLEKGIKILTLYVFSTENWNRSKKEVNYLMKLFALVFNRKNIQDLHQKGIKVNVIGQIERLSKALQEKISKAEKLTNDNKKGILNLAVSYGGRADIMQAIKQIVKKKTVVTEKAINNNLWTKGLPDPDLIIRTGGEQRFSNFLIWQSAYSELYFTKKFWPDFTIDDLDEALEDYNQRHRRFGK